MKTKEMNKKILSLSLIICLFSMILVGCSTSGKNPNGDNDSTTGDVPKNTVTVELSIIYPDESELDTIEVSDLAIEDGDSALDALLIYGKNANIPVVMDASDSTYVKGIGGIFEKDYGETTGWVYTVNDETVMVMASDYYLEDGDIVKWEYVDFSEM